MYCIPWEIEKPKEVILLDSLEFSPKPDFEGTLESVEEAKEKEGPIKFKFGDVKWKLNVDKIERK